jgi:hypothetical protein
LHPQERLLQEARDFQESAAFDEYRQIRQTAEHRLARLVQLGIRQARYFGRKKTLFQLLMTATVANLTLMANKREGEGTEECPSFSLSSNTLAFTKSVWTYLSHFALNLTPIGRQKPAFRLGF